MCFQLCWLNGENSDKELIGGQVFDPLKNNISRIVTATVYEDQNIVYLEMESMCQLWTVFAL